VTEPNPARPPLAVVLLSGGLDSSTVAALARSRGFQVIALTVAYGQRHSVEIEAATRIAVALGVRRHVLQVIALHEFGGSALTDTSIDVPKDRATEDMTASIPPTYVPARNTILLSLALSLAEATGARDIFCGVNALDYSGYPDCRPAFIDAFQALANVATKAGVEADGTTGLGVIKIHAPLIHMTKVQIIDMARALSLDLSMTHSCYDPVGPRACGRCDSCRIRLDAFAALGIQDPAPYAPGPRGE